MRQKKVSTKIQLGEKNDEYTYSYYYS